MISTDEVLKIHNILIEKFGGAYGVRDNNLLGSSIQRPFNSFDNVDLYPPSIDKAAAIIGGTRENIFRFLK